MDDDEPEVDEPDDMSDDVLPVPRLLVLGLVGAIVPWDDAAPVPAPVAVPELLERVSDEPV